MKIKDHRPCFICHGNIIRKVSMLFIQAQSREPSNIIPIRPQAENIVQEWYGICDYCIDLYPEIMQVFARVSDLKDDVEPCNHTVMFNLIESIKESRWGCRFIVPYKKKNPK